jgi:hypothetical protein
VLFTTNLTFAEWSRLLWNAKMTAALFDRLNHHSYIVEAGNESYRFLHSTKKAKSQIKAREQSKKECIKEEEIEQHSEEPFQIISKELTFRAAPYALGN